MSLMSELHDDLSTIHAILLGQRQVAMDVVTKHNMADSIKDRLPYPALLMMRARVQCIDDLLLEFEAAGVVWPDNVVELSPGDVKLEPWERDRG